MRCALLGLLSGLLLVPAQAQILHADGPLPSFEVATIKPGDGPGRWPTETTQFADGWTAQMLIRNAYNLPPGSGPTRILNGPEWTRKDMYTLEMKIGAADVEAMRKIPAIERDRRIQLMEQQLLADRFKLKVHFETRELPTYELVAVKSGAKVTPAKYPNPMGLVGLPKNPGDDIQRGMLVTGVGTRQDGSVTQTQTIMMKSYTVPMLVGFLSGKREVGGRTIVDKTGLKGAYDITLTLSSGIEQAEDHINLFTALEDQLGLKLVPGKGQVEVLVIDNVERPTAN